MLDRNRLLAAFGTAALCVPVLAGADDEKEFDRSPVDCISVSRIDKTDIIDDQTILFFMRGKRIYRNYLPSKCPGLEVEDRFGYRTVTSRLCRVDMINVLPRIGFPTACRLGEFTPISAEEVEELHAVHDKRQRGDGVEVKPVEPRKRGAAKGDDAKKDDAKDDKPASE
ncbi:MAG TPA: hypothetical protein VFJ95_09580 [Gammaproteobacteria bacterium]|jgi:hypothetical protein|nr:hypothetical protein [Gammaproteobacteria bacterium]